MKGIGRLRNAITLFSIKKVRIYEFSPESMWLRPGLSSRYEVAGLCLYQHRHLRGNRVGPVGRAICGPGAPERLTMWIEGR